MVLYEHLASIPDIGIDYEEYLAKIVALTKAASNPGGATYPDSMNSAARRALYDNLSNNEDVAAAIDTDIRKVKKDDWRGNTFKEREIRNAIRCHVSDNEQVEFIMDLVKSQHEY